MSRMNPVPAALLLGLVAGLCGLAAPSAGAGGARPDAGAGTASVIPSQQPWKAVAASGRVEWRALAAETSPWGTVRRGDHLRPESVVRTQKRSRTTLARSGDIILVDPLSEILLPANRPGAETLIHHGSGNALYRIEPSPGRQVTVETPFLVAGVKGTIFSVVVQPGHASVSVVSGRVEVRCTVTGEMTDLFAGDMAVFDDSLGAMEVYRERREHATESAPEVSRSAREALKATVDLIEEASSSLDTRELGEEAFTELATMDLSEWSLERDLSDLELDATLKEDRTLLANEEDQRLLKLGLKQP